MIMKLGIDKARETMMKDYGGPFGAVIVKNNEVIAVEYKDTNKSSISYAHKMQLAAYSLLLSNTYKKDSSRCIIIYGNNVRFHEVFIKEQDILQLKKILSKINKMVEKAVFPDSSAGEKKCLQCEYLNYCDDRF